MRDDYSGILQLMAGIVGLCAYIPLTIGILKDTARQSFAAFFLWGMLDTIAMVSAVLQAGNYWLAASNVVGAFGIAALLLYKRQFEWTITETITSLLVIVCLVIWYRAGNTVAIVASSLAVVIAGIPQMVHTRRQPEQTPIGAYLVWLSANILSFVSGRAWTIDERLYAFCAVILCVAILAIAWLSARRRR